MKLSILVCSVLGRRKTFLPNILEQLNNQVEQYDDVEVLVLIDNKTRMLGDKRNDLVKISQGDFLVAVDDDDILADDYVSTLREAIINNPTVDVITFIVSVSLNNGPYKPCYYSKDYPYDYNKNEAYYRLPNHIMCVNRKLAIETPYKPITKGEDAAYSKDLHPKLKTEYKIEKVLYYYNFSNMTSETQKKIIKKQ